MNFNEWQSYNEFLNQRIESFLPKTKTFLAKVQETDGYFVSVLPFTEEENMEVMEGIPILQSKYFSPIVQAEDIGLLIDISINISPLLENNVNVKISEQTYYVFLPLVMLEDFTNGEGNADILQIKSSDLQTSLNLTNENISLFTPKASISINEDSLNFSGEGSIAVSATSDLSISGENVNINSKSKLNADTKDLTIKASGNLSMVGGSDPIEVGNSVGTLGAVIDDLVTLMDMLASGLTGASSNPSAYQGGKTAIVQKIKKVLK